MTAGALAINVVLVILCGLIPYYMAKERGNRSLARIALAVCWGTGFIAGLWLAIPAAIILGILALRSPRLAA
jgi:hypothetical protein